MNNVSKFGNKALKSSIKGRLWSIILIIVLLFSFIMLKAKIISTDNTENELTSISSECQVIDKYNIASDYIFDQKGIASWYGKKFHNRKTANGERYNMYGFSAAHKILPFGTILKVTNLKNNKSVLVRINDRGPYIKKRIIDLSYTSASRINGIGLSKVKIKGFLPNVLENSNIDDSKYYFGYSIDKPLVCLPENVVTLIDSAKSFKTAIKLYKKHKLESQNLVYLVVPSDQLNRKENKNTYNYFVGTINSFPLNDDIYLAEK